ncbi:hypothetical protein [Methylobacterium sp. J-070]|uniref:hypothetical protein n=1 Tax=Methylobacterium sp. J-070 TaxID=2836650 RepID=UPI001FB9997B|nr:hypothetical protein [Methylobacterium sp. J-070]MCJ2050384.1 hypothetical protein [Methylobacterium sp. J-070]
MSGPAALEGLPRALAEIVGSQRIRDRVAEAASPYAEPVAATAEDIRAASGEVGIHSARRSHSDDRESISAQIGMILAKTSRIFVFLDLYLIIYNQKTNINAFRYLTRLSEKSLFT